MLTYVDDEFSKMNMKSSSGSNEVLLKVSLSKYGADSKNIVIAEIINLCKAGQQNIYHFLPLEYPKTHI